MHPLTYALRRPSTPAATGVRAKGRSSAFFLVNLCATLLLLKSYNLCYTIYR
jgi:hypothetical protein